MPLLVLKGCVITWAAQALKVKSVAAVNFGEWEGSIQSCNGELRGGNVENYTERGRRCQSQTCIALITFLNPKAGESFV